MKIPDEIMERRRLERLRHVTFFLSDQRVPSKARRVLGLSATHNLLTGFFENSYWRVAWWCAWKAVTNSYETARVWCQFFYWQKILRLNHDQIDERIERSA